MGARWWAKTGQAHPASIHHFTIYILICCMVKTRTLLSEKSKYLQQHQRTTTKPNYSICQRSSDSISGGTHRLNQNWTACAWYSHWTAHVCLLCQGLKEPLKKNSVRTCESQTKIRASSLWGWQWLAEEIMVEQKNKCKWIISFPTVSHRHNDHKDGRYSGCCSGGSNAGIKFPSGMEDMPDPYTCFKFACIFAIKAGQSGAWLGKVWVEKEKDSR